MLLKAVQKHLSQPIFKARPIFTQSAYDMVGQRRPQKTLRYFPTSLVPFFLVHPPIFETFRRPWTYIDSEYVHVSRKNDCKALRVIDQVLESLEIKKSNFEWLLNLVPRAILRIPWGRGWAGTIYFRWWYMVFLNTT